VPVEGERGALRVIIGSVRNKVVGGGGATFPEGRKGGKPYNLFWVRRACQKKFFRRHQKGGGYSEQGGKTLRGASGLRKTKE